MRQTFLSIPREIEEAALMEGCRWWLVVFQVLIPMSQLILLLSLSLGEGAKTSRFSSLSQEGAKNHFSQPC